MIPFRDPRPTLLRHFVALGRKRLDSDTRRRTTSTQQPPIQPQALTDARGKNSAHYRPKATLQRVLQAQSLYGVLRAGVLLTVLMKAGLYAFPVAVEEARRDALAGDYVALCVIGDDGVRQLVELGVPDRRDDADEVAIDGAELLSAAVPDNVDARRLVGLTNVAVD